MDNSLIKRQEAIDAIEITPFDDYGDYMRARELIEALPSAQPHWIPCSERLPNSNGCYLVWRPNFWGGEIGMPAICYFDGQNTWHDSYGVDFERTLPPNNVIAWMPLPDLYEGE
jgi:hypothetical protein